MGIDWALFKFGKGQPRVIERRQKRLDTDALECTCRAEVWKRYGRRCEVPGCPQAKDRIEQHHIILRSKSKRLLYAPENRAVLCKVHHDLRHAGKIEILPRTKDGELIVKGPKALLKFKL